MDKEYLKFRHKELNTEQRDLIDKLNTIIAERMQIEQDFFRESGEILVDE